MDQAKIRRDQATVKLVKFYIIKDQDNCLLSLSFGGSKLLSLEPKITGSKLWRGCWVLVEGQGILTDHTYMWGDKRGQ